MYSIVIIEDDPAYISMMETILTMDGFDVRSSSDGKSGLARIREKRPDLILCDIMMPEMDGHFVLDTLRGEEAFADVPFIFVSALGDRSDVRRGMSEGADDYLPKPFTADELLAAVTGRIRRHEAVHLKHGTADYQEEQAILRQKITKREREVLLKVGQGLTSREIADQLGVALKTIEVHRASLMNKLGACNAAALARWAIIAELIDH